MTKGVGTEPEEKSSEYSVLLFPNMKGLATREGPAGEIRRSNQ